MSIHDAFLELAATAVDFDLDVGERTELERHIAGCEACGRTAYAFREDAAAIWSGSRPQLSPARSDAILAAALRPPTSQPPLRLLVVAALVTVLGAALIAAGVEYFRTKDPLVAVLPSPEHSSVAVPSSEPTLPEPTSQASAATPRPPGSPAAGALPVHGSAQELGRAIRMAPGAGGDLYVSIPARAGTVLTRFDSTGLAHAGWPQVLAGATSCELLLPAADGSVRVLCTSGGPDGNEFSVRAFAFDSNANLLAGWPIDLDDHGADGYFAARVIGDELTVYAWKSLGDQIEPGQPAGDVWIVTVAADGTVRSGAQVPYGTDCCSDTWAVGPDGVAYGTVHHFATEPAASTSELTAVSFAGVPAGFPVAIDGIASEPAFDGAGRIHVTVGLPFERPARTLAFDPDGRAVDAGSGEMEIAAASEFAGIEGTGGSPMAPLVGPDGTTFVIDIVGGRTTVASVSPSGELLAGWPYRSDAGHQVTGFCPAGDVCEGSFWATPAVGPGNVLYLLHAAASHAAGGSIVAIDPDGRVIVGWPVGLLRPGAEFWSVVAGTDGTAYALAIEPEPNSTYSATILYLATNSSVIGKVTIVEP